jgi:hypothetical protein
VPLPLQHQLPSQLLQPAQLNPRHLPAPAGDAGSIDTAAAEELLSAAQEFLAFTARFA